MNVSILGYGCGNIISLRNALEYLGACVNIIKTPSAITQAEKLIIPGVGAFGFGIDNIANNGFLDNLHNIALHKKRPILGICLGAQLMLEESEESPGKKGFQWVKGKVKKIIPNDTYYRVPHVGWDSTCVEGTNPYLEKGKREIFYYAHSYYMSLEDPSLVIATCSYVHSFTAVFQSENIIGCQFHPEKSQKSGLAFLEKFLKHKE